LLERDQLETAEAESIEQASQYTLPRPQPYTGDSWHL
jgi:hypothetical protein